MTGAELQALIDAAGRGYVDGAGGDYIRLPAGTIELAETIVSGGDTTLTAQVGLRFRGESRAQTMFKGNDGNSGGTVLKWVGEPGGTMWRHLGGAFPHWSDLTFQMDPGNPDAVDPNKKFDGKCTARVGLELSGNNANSAVTQTPSLERVAIHGSRDAKPRDTIGLRVTGAKQDDQVDGGHFSNVEINKVGIAVQIENQQAVECVIDRGKLAGNVAAVYVKEGSLCMRECETNARTLESCHVWVGRLANYVRCLHQYSEVKDCEAVFKIGGDTSGNQSFRSNLVVTGGRFNHQGDSSLGDSLIPLVTGTWQGIVTFRDCDFTAAGGEGDRNSRGRFFTFEGQTSGECIGRLRLWDNNCWDRFGGFLMGDFDPAMEVSIDGDRQHLDLWRGR